ncbi:Uma2 family endonuclease [Pseudanabaena sp. 'Roaring Creek']|uniref:Uma2 family endonuclease n=1 Tax=Pseudanabaena sp. 'Roaring Creek' TaxID=1681830 RepID=UPI0006D84717|nr:Uma2 family endonuclease [Pseudanabaena sp. 'Roaring Creek']
MVITAAKPHSLETFLALPETKPASEFINDKISQKPMPQGKHSLLQGTLCEIINQVVKFSKIAIAFPELRCTFGGASIVPDVCVLRWERIPRDPDGQIANKILTYPDWTMEILSHRQSPNKVLANILHCIENGTELGWMLDSEEQNIFVISSDRRIQMFKGVQSVPVLSGVDLTLTVTQIFEWLNF